MSDDSGICSPKSDISIIEIETEIVNEKTGTSLPNNDNSAVEDNTDKALPPVQVFSLALKDFSLSEVNNCSCRVLKLLMSSHLIMSPPSPIPMRLTCFRNQSLKNLKPLITYLVVVKTRQPKNLRSQRRKTENL